MAGCKRVTAKAYASRPSPPFHASDCKGQTKKGNDGASYTSVADSRGIYKWVASNSSTRKARAPPSAAKATYKIHDNGATPFKVADMAGSTAWIYVASKWDKKNPDADPTYTLWKKVPYKTLYLAKDAQKGNSLLLKLAAGRYMYIGDRIYEFNTIGGEEVLEYRSPIGNSDVPYPWARTATHTYLMIEDTVIENAVLPARAQPYDEFYKIHFADMCRRGYGGGCDKYKTPEVKEYLKRLDTGSKKFKTKQIHARNN
jgi:hypothetical protein